VNPTGPGRLQFAMRVRVEERIKDAGNNIETDDKLCGERVERVGSLVKP